MVAMILRCAQYDRVDASPEDSKSIFQTQPKPTVAQIEFLEEVRAVTDYSLLEVRGLLAEDHKQLRSLLNEDISTIRLWSEFTKVIYFILIPKH